MPLYRVEVEESNTWTIYVDAPDERTAEDEALTLSALLDPDSTDDFALALPVSHANDDEDVWVGGEEGEFIPHSEYKSAT